MKKLIFTFLAFLFFSCDSIDIEYTLDIIYTDGSKEAVILIVPKGLRMPYLDEGCIKAPTYHEGVRCGVRSFTYKKKEL